MRYVRTVARLATMAALVAGLSVLVAPSEALAAGPSAAQPLNAAVDVDIVSIIMSVFGLIGDILGFVASIVGGAMTFNVAWPYGPEAAGALSMKLSVPPFPGSGSALARAATTCALTLGPYLWWRKRVTRTQN